jgi:hypothetical protein
MATVTDDAVKAAVTALISDYFKIHGEALANLETRDLTGLFVDPSGKNAVLNQGELDYLIKLRQRQSNNLKILNCQSELSFSSLTDDGGILGVQVIENSSGNFAFTPDVQSHSSGIHHLFYLEKVGDTYRILEHTKDEDTFNLLQADLGDATSGWTEILADQQQRSLQSVDRMAQEKAILNAGFVTPEKTLTQNPYDAEAALQYARTWVAPHETLRNTDAFEVYDDYGGNCNNYISQCLHAGGIPMDYFGPGKDQWKWFSDEVNLDETDWGRSPAWAGVDDFYLYARENTGYGLVAAVEDNVYDGAPGDVLQLGCDGNWFHSVLITSVVKDKDGKVLDYLIASNTTDRMDYPVSAYGYPEIRLIKILGWNGS